VPNSTVPMTLPGRLSCPCGPSSASSGWMDTLRPLLLVSLGKRTVLPGSTGMVTPAGQVSGGLSLRPVRRPPDVTRLRLAHMAGRRDPGSAIFLSPRLSSSRPLRLGRPSEPSLRGGFASPDPASAHQEISACDEGGGNHAPAGWAALV